MTWKQRTGLLWGALIAALLIGCWAFISAGSDESVRPIPPGQKVSNPYGDHPQDTGYVVQGVMDYRSWDAEFDKPPRHGPNVYAGAHSRRLIASTVGKHQQKIDGSMPGTLQMDTGFPEPELVSRKVNAEQSGEIGNAGLVPESAL